MSEITGLTIKIEDNSEAVLKQFGERENKALEALARAALANWDRVTRAVDITGRDAVDTGKYVTSQGALIPTGVVQGIPLDAEDRIEGRSQPGEVVIGTKVIYSRVLEHGWAPHNRPARNILGRAIQNNKAEYEKVVKDTFEGNK